MAYTYLMTVNDVDLRVVYSHNWCNHVQLVAVYPHIPGKRVDADILGVMAVGVIDDITSEIGEYLNEEFPYEEA